MEGKRDNLIPIGRFAFLSRLSRRALRFYDERELLKPAFVDEWTGYRYYSPEQLTSADSIRELREIDLPLDEVALSQAWRDVYEWISGQGLKVRAMPYEVYRVDMMQAASPAELVTEIVIPVA